jgi:hypothetical protein
MSLPIRELVVSLDVDGIINRALVTVYPPETVGSVQVLWQARTTLRIAPGETRTVYALFRDSQGRRCGAVDVVTPVASTDYTVNDRADGGGFDYTSSAAFSITTTTEATRMQITLQNTATGPLYVTLLQVRGKPLEVYDPITIEQEDATSQASYETRSLALDLPMQDNPVFAQAYAEYLVGRYANPARTVERLVVENRAALGPYDLFGLEIMDKIMITDAQTALQRVAHWVRGVAYELARDGFRVTLLLERADDRQYWLLEKAGYSELGSATRLGL